MIRKQRQTEKDKALDKGAKMNAVKKHGAIGDVSILERKSLLGDGSVFLLFNSDGMQLMGMQEFPNPETAWKALR